MNAAASWCVNYSAQAWPRILERKRVTARDGIDLVKSRSLRYRRRYTLAAVERIGA